MRITPPTNKTIKLSLILVIASLLLIFGGFVEGGIIGLTLGYIYLLIGVTLKGW